MPPYISPMLLAKTPKLPMNGAALNLTSLLELLKGASHYDSPIEILNVALLSLMGRLRVARACVLLPSASGLEMAHSKGGVPPFSVPLTEILEPILVSELTHRKVFEERRLHWLIPIHVNNVTVAVLCLGKTPNDAHLDPDVRSYVDLMRAILSIAVNNVESIVSLRHSARELERSSLLVHSLYEFSRDFTGVMDEAAILKLLSLRLMGQLMTSSFAIFFSPDFNRKDRVVDRSQNSGFSQVYPLVLGLDAPVIVEQMDKNNTLRESFLSVGIGMATPMNLHGRQCGVLVVGEKLNAIAYEHAELQFLEAAANIVVTALENDRLERERVEMVLLENELSIAKEIQAGLLPIDLPIVKGLEIAAETRFSRQIGGDYYDVIQLDNERTIVAIADVSGKGVPAAILMANVQAALNCLARLDLPLSTIMWRINQLLVDNTAPEVFITMFVALLNTSNGSIEYVNAGHNPPILFHAGGVVLLQEGGVLTGVLRDPPPYRQGIENVRQGDVLVLYTDGVTEAFNASGEEFGVASLVECVSKELNATAPHILKSISDTLSVHTGNIALADDTSMMVLRIL